MTDTSREAVERLRWGRAEKSGMNLQANCPFGNYYIALRGEYGWMWWRPASGPAHMGLEPTEEAAKAAAQADYEQRVLAALNPALLTRAETAEARLAEATAQIHRLTAVGDGLSAFVCDEGDPDVKRWRKACDEAFRTIFRKDQGRDQ